MAITRAFMSSERPLVMGVLNVTPDSFYDGGLHSTREAAIARASEMVAEGVDIIDVGGESTRPGAASVSEQQELDRIASVVEALASQFDVAVSVDTSSPKVMAEAITLGVSLINDVRALSRVNNLEFIAQSSVSVCLMHMQGEPLSMQACPEYHGVVEEVGDFLAERIGVCRAAGIAQDRLLIDPGFGFGKSDTHNLALLKGLERLSHLDCPLLVGVSRKSMIGRLLGRDVNERLAGSLGFGLVALQRGASILRVHDVAATVDLVKVFQLTKG